MVITQPLTWMKDGNCVSVKDNTIFFAPDKDLKKQRAAKRICTDCKVRKNCLIWGIETDSIGIFGGMTETERHLLVAILRAKRTTLRVFLDIESPKDEQKIRTETNTSCTSTLESPSENAGRHFQLVI